MNRNLSIIISILLLTGCVNTEWQNIKMETSGNSDNSTSSEFNGEIPNELRDWDIVADVSDQWLSCNYGFVLAYTKISIDDHNRIWIYGPDQWNGPIGGIPDNPGCGGDSNPRIIIFDQGSKHSETFSPEIGEGAFVSTASGWTHLNNDKVLLTNVLIIKSPWDGPSGGEDNKYVDIAILENGTFHDLLSESSSTSSVPDYAIFNDFLYAIFNAVPNAYPQIKIFNLGTETLVKSVDLKDCDNPSSIETTDENIFLLCSDENFDYSLNVYSKEFMEIYSWKVYFPGISGVRIRGLPLSRDEQGNVWVGYNYIVKNEKGNLTLEQIIPNKDMISVSNNYLQLKTIIGVAPYKNGMLFSIDGAFYLADYDQKEWRVLNHNAPPLPIAKGTDGKIYAFTGKYIISSKP
jgi:hypothetical protein